MSSIIQTSSQTEISHGSAAGLTISELPNLMKRWMLLQEDMNTLNAALKEKRTHSKSLRDMILRIMDSHKIATLNVSKGSVIHKTREVKQSMNAEYLAKHCKEFFQGDEERANALLAYLEQHRVTTVKHDLRLATNTGSGSDGGSM